MRLLYSCLLLTWLFSCDVDISQNQHFRREPGIVQIQLNALDIDTILLNHPNSSYDGFFAVHSDSIYFLDKLFATATVFDLSGKFVGQHLGKGEGPNEVEGIRGYIQDTKNHIIFKGYSVYSFDNNWKKIKHAVLRWESDKSQKELINNPEPDDIGIYEVKYKPEMYKIFDSEYFILNTESTHPKFNAYFTSVSQNFYQNAYTFALVNRKSLKIEKLFGHYPDIFQNSNIPNYANWYADITPDQVYMNFEADSLIYVYDKKSLQPSFCLGISGRGMKQNYKATDTYDEAMDRWIEDRVSSGYYTDIEVFDEQELIFRIYTLGTDESDFQNKSVTDEHFPKRMQIYYKKKLVGDVQVPNRFTIIGFIDGYFIADGLIDEQNQAMGLYKFKLPVLQ